MMTHYWIAFSNVPGLEFIHKRCDSLEEAKEYDTGRGRPNCILLFDVDREVAYARGAYANQRAQWFRTDPAVVSKDYDAFTEREN